MKKIMPPVVLVLLLIGITIIVSCKKEDVIPTLTTSAVTDITINSGTTGGLITKDGGAAVTARGVCWATTSSPVISGSHSSDGRETGSFTSDITGLTPNTLYHVRAYATNKVGTAYGTEVTFTTTPIVLATLTTTALSSVTLTTAVSGGTITSNGGALITASGICWATTPNPVATDSHTTDGTFTGSFPSTMTGLSAGTTYHVRAYATNSNGTAYGNDLSFTTTTGTATLSTTAVTSITLISAVSGGTITSDGGAAITVSGICWATTSNPVATGSHTTDGTTTGSFPSTMTGLSAGTTYHVRAYATNSNGTAYGTDLSFTTLTTTASLTTAVPSTITYISAVSGGTITSNGGATITVSGICWSTSLNPVATGSHTTDGTITGTFPSTMTSLSQGTQYFVRAYATNSVGTAYGNELSFNTKMADVDGNTYNTVTIGLQVWMAENLKTTKYSDASHTAIPNTTGDAAWAALNIPAYCWYNNDVSNKNIYGAMYNWFTVNTGLLCPTGWHAPTDVEFQTLELSLGMSASDVLIYGYAGTDQGTQMKNTTGWAAGENGTNTSGWSALPGGYRFAGTGTFNNLGDLSYWWTNTTDLSFPTTAWYRRLDGLLPDVTTDHQVYRATVDKQGGKYVRCVKD
jgi:Fibrobacter succinogenes major domain (Fib_succ_major).